MTGEEIRKYIKTYDGFDNAGGLTVFSPEKRKRLFEWKSNVMLLTPQGFLLIDKPCTFVDNFVDFLAWPFEVYFQERNVPKDLAQLANRKFNQDIKPRIELMKKETKTLIGFLNEAGHKQTGSLNQILKNLDDSEGLLQDVLIPHFVESGRKSSKGKGIITEEFPEKTARRRLILRLHDVLSGCTNLTNDNQAIHILRLLNHLEIEGLDYVSHEPISKFITSKRSEKEWANMMQAATISGDNRSKIN